MIALTALWFLVGAAPSYALMLADFQRSYPGQADTEAENDVFASVCIALLCGIIGPLGLLLALWLTRCGDHGLIWWPPSLSRASRREA